LQTSTQYRSGLIYGLIAYVCWGTVPLYFVQVKSVWSVEILAHRIGWSLPLMLLVTVLTPRGVAHLLTVFRFRRLLVPLLVSSVLLSGNWLLYIYAIVTDRVSEASLGYYMMPLVNAFLATLFLGEQLRPAHYPALLLIALGVAIPFVAKQNFTWLAVVLPITFGLYGLVRKKIPVDSSTGLTVETLLLFPPCLALVAYRSATGATAFGTDAALSGWLMFGGVVTVVPLLAYTLSIRRIPLITQALIQFISPTVQLLIAILVFKEPMSWDRWSAIGCVWLASAVFITDAGLRTRQVKQRMKKPVERSVMGVPSV
jgi:chloramphenicol-sensitive protein RarD